MSSPTADAIGDAAASRRAARWRRGAEAWRRRSHIIHLYRVLLPALILAVLAVLGGWVVYNVIVAQFGPAKGSGGVAIRMINPKFYGRSGDDQPFVISAASATRDDRDLARVVLIKPVFVVAAGLPNENTLTSADGVYREDTKVLRLEKDVVVTDKRGYTFNAQKAVIDTRTGVIQGESPIDGAGPLGRIAASSYSIEDRGERIIFRGGVRSRIERPGAR